jgi:mono/diheme cytochrome c family protein
MFDLESVLLVFGLALALGWLTRRAWRARISLVKWLGGGICGFLTLALCAALLAAMVGYRELTRDRGNPIPNVEIAITTERVARGEHLSVLCAGCHAPEEGVALTGQDFLVGDAPPIGTFLAPNLTPVHLEDWSDGEIVRAIREGVHRSGRSLLIMPSSAWRHFSDEDVHAIVAYLRSLPPAGSEAPPNRLNVLGAIMVLAVPVFQAQPPITEPVLSPPAGASAAYGAYVSSITCEFCHGSDLLGDPEFGTPPLVAIPVAWSEDEFITFMRTGTRPDGSKVNGDLMPWKDMSAFLNDDAQLRGVYAHLDDLAARWR